MAPYHPAPVLDHCLRQFLFHWNNGLQPYLNIQTKSDGTVVIKTEMICSKPLHSNTQYPRYGYHHKRSSLNSRTKRRIQRSNGVNYEASSSSIQKVASLHELKTKTSTDIAP